MKIKHEEIVEMLGSVKLPGSAYNFHRLLNAEEKSRIASVITQEVNQWIHDRLAGNPRDTQA